jgi:DnaJ-class molecular chaperone
MERRGMTTDYREICRTCEGTGTVVIESTLTYPEGDPEVRPCGGCDGLGAILTQEGRKLIEFLELVSPEVLGRRVPEGGFE